MATAGASPGPTAPVAHSAKRSAAGKAAPEEALSSTQAPPKGGACAPPTLPAAAASSQGGSGGAPAAVGTTKSARADSGEEVPATAVGPHATYSCSPGAGGAGNCTVKGVHRAGKAATAALSGGTAAEAAAMVKPEAVTGKDSASVGYTQPKGRMRHELGGLVCVAVGVGAEEGEGGREAVEGDAEAEAQQEGEGEGGGEREAARVGEGAVEAEAGREAAGEPVAVAVHVGGTAVPALLQLAGQGHGMGASEPTGQ